MFGNVLRVVVDGGLAWEVSAECVIECGGGVTGEVGCCSLVRVEPCGGSVAASERRWLCGGGWRNNQIGRPPSSDSYTQQREKNKAALSLSPPYRRPRHHQLSLYRDRPRRKRHLVLLFCCCSRPALLVLVVVAVAVVSQPSALFHLELSNIRKAHPP